MLYVPKGVAHGYLTLENKTELLYFHSNIYNKKLANISSLILPKVLAKRKHAWHLYVVRVINRNRLLKKLKKIAEILIHYPLPPHTQECYRGLGFKKNAFPISVEIHKTIFSLPISRVMKKKDAKEVVKKIKSILS